MSEEEKYWGCTPVVTEHMEAMLKASREYAKMVSNDDETPKQIADRAKDFQCGAMWEDGCSKKHNWHKGDETPHLNNEGKSEYYLALLDGYDEYHPAKVAYNKDRWVISLDEFPDYPVKVIWWIEMPEKTAEMKQFSRKD